MAVSEASTDNSKQDSKSDLHSLIMYIIIKRISMRQVIGLV